MKPDGILVPGDTNELSAAIRKAVGAGTYEKVEVMLPQFEREDGSKVYYYPSTVEEFDNLKLLPDKLLLDFGLRKWDDEGGVVHWLYPGEWFKFVPEGYGVIDIFGTEENFEREKADDDIRYGCLPYGFKRAIENVRS